MLEDPGAIKRLYLFKPFKICVQLLGYRLFNAYSGQEEVSRIGGRGLDPDVHHFLKSVRNLIKMGTKKNQIFGFSCC
ncbi:MAG: hypothetical protein B6I30_05200 [Desulfobacteraceae bacterium 4572_187]|nr:MAG: hypothetical protein B6I30_05200 [Desulfobacteraceae bacterium 4572_187]